MPSLLFDQSPRSRTRGSHLEGDNDHTVRRAKTTKAVFTTAPRGLSGFTQTMVNLGFEKAGDFEDCLGGGLARRDANAPIGHAERFGDGRFDSGVRLAALWRCRHTNLERVAEPSLDGIPRRRWDDLDPKLDRRSSLPPQNAFEHR